MNALACSPLAFISALVALVLMIAAALAPWIAPYDAFDPASANLIDARLPPGSEGLTGDYYMLGTDPTGRDLFSAMLYGLRISLIVAFGSIGLAGFVGVGLGLVAGYFQGLLDALIMRLADIQLSIPPILVALLINGITTAILGKSNSPGLAIIILIIAISTSLWVQFARTVRALVLVEKAKDYIAAAQITGVSTRRIILRHLLPNVTAPVLVVATVNFAVAILVESTLSFLGVGVPVTEPSLGTLIRIGNEFLFSGDWWMSMLPAACLVILTLAINLFADWLRDALNPILQAGA
jgi:peptide/nickel transport system permease protein